ncbi:diguanylate cyclase [Simplicispira lacusdiani]|uniref:diguanylate cyclase n=1 Tax=Simplicispira lacusdiani TaxID=2213010 RepID=UPI000E74F590|nr:diguanylate cyclase [Simplicispira lacusdiani]
MTSAPANPPPHGPRHPGDNGPASRRRTFRHIYPLRVLGMGLGGLLVASVLHQHQTLRDYWVLAVLSFLVWPHLAYLHARHSTNPFRAEIYNLLIDSAMVGLWVPLMHFNLLPSVVLAAVTTYDKFSTGIKRLWLHSLPGMFGTGVLVTLLARPELRLESSLTVIVCTLPLIIVHSLAVSVASYRLIRTVARQNRQLEAMRRTDAQTGLAARSHWQEQASDSLERYHASGEPACLLMIDIDHFKSINDLHGHTVGDEVIRAVGQVIRDCVRAHDHAGRYGGDEFAVVCGDTRAPEAHAIAERIRDGIAGLRLRELPGLRLTSSIGLAETRRSQLSLRDWINDADAALYRAKDQGRNQVAGPSAPAQPQPV